MNCGENSASFSLSFEEAAKIKCLPYTIRHPDEKIVVIQYVVPLDSIDELIVRPIFACGSQFTIEIDSSFTDLEIESVKQGGVKTEAETSDPHHTAREIGRRLFKRWKDGSGNMACPLS